MTFKMITTPGIASQSFIVDGVDGERKIRIYFGSPHDSVGSSLKGEIQGIDFAEATKEERAAAYQWAKGQI